MQPHFDGGNKGDDELVRLGSLSALWLTHLKSSGLASDQVVNNLLDKELHKLRCLEGLQQEDQQEEEEQEEDEEKAELDTRQTMDGSGDGFRRNMSRRQRNLTIDDYLAETAAMLAKTDSDLDESYIPNTPDAQQTEGARTL